MRLIPTSFTVVALSATFMVVPTVTSGATPRPVSPVVHDVAIPAVAGVGAGTAKRSTTASGTGADAVDRHGAGDPVVATKQVQGVDFDLAGVTFDSAPPAGTHVEVRTHGESGWSGWTDLELDGDGPDPGSADARHARPGTEAVAAAGSDGLDVRVTTPDGTLPRGLRASLVDGGRSSADDALATPAGSAVAAVTRPTIISRAEWGADESLRTCDAERLPGFKAVVVHHTVNSNTYTADQAPAIIRSIYSYHTQSQGWCDIGYQILVDRFGRAYEGRKGSPDGFVQGAQAGGFNAETTGISVIGDFTSVPFPAATQSTVTKLVAWEADRSLFDPTSSVTLTSAGNSKFDPGERVTLPRTIGHRDLSLTGCPGDTAYAQQLPAIRSGAGTIWRDGQWDPQPAVPALETYARPASSTFALSGRGFGHGVGLSQWGAYGAATKALTWQQIVGFYYPGTTRTAQGDPTLRVWLSAVGTSGTQFSNVSGMVVSDGKRQSTLPSTYRWRIVPEGSAVTLQANSGAGWFVVTTWRGSTLPLTVSRPSTSSVRVLLPSGTQREYAGSVRVVPVSGKAYAVNLVGSERYTRAVVPVEMSASWPAAALSAQAVAARTYAAHSRAAAGSRVYDICDVSCQAYNGIADYSSAGTLVRRYEDTRSTNATTATAGNVLTYGGKPAYTQYSASNGGRTVSGGTAYLPAKTDPYDGAVVSASNPSAWTTSLTAASVEKAFPTVGTLRTIAVGSRTGGGGTGTWGGRVASVTVAGSAGTSTVSGDTFRTRLGLRSTWWTVTSAPVRSVPISPRDVTGERLPDVILPSGSTLKTVSYTGSMAFTTKQILSAGFSGMRAAAAVGPWSQDSLGDVVAIDAAGTAWYYPGLGRSGLNAGRYQLATGWGSVNLVVPVGDWDGDGKTDIAARTTDGRLVLHRGDGTGRIVSSTTIGTGWGGLRQVTSGEYDGDGRRDLVAVRATDGALVLYPGNGTGGFRPAVDIGASGWNAMSAVRGIGDLTGDGRDDLLARRASDGKLLVYRVQAAARLTAPLAAGTYASTVAWGQ
ncbi:MULTISPECIES: SpoIID/LytB domain-containing protein [unclassified Terrabacter]|uniref:SpoIID/LytB domain-containing protein n=1 Tax=unclassified Terrabacter TaxID=2630222 RepID=UPI0006F57387|nr:MULTISPECIES: SpoIID/LytB domain-containing protein [unclassified Terrabacter]KRB44296.1 hypothetical protein ASD90_18065 [Terrabacter sp. Root181]KRF39292.1 hypothetical protein ASG96_13235 [Terrabacter sp. Soil810]